MGRYEDVFRRSLTDPAGFWAEAAQHIDWYAEPETILDDSNPPFYRWFRGGALNTCHNALDRHVDGGRGDQQALIYDSPVTGTKKTFTFKELRDETARFAGVLSSLGIEKGDRVVIYMPMIPEAVVAMLACRRAAPDRRRPWPAQDALGKDLAEDHARHRQRQQRRAGAFHDRRPGCPRRASSYSSSERSRLTLWSSTVAW
jgi:Acetyl-coenzyme A synthetase N-terminus/AMP-binding enzyme